MNAQAAAAEKSSLREAMSKADDAIAKDEPVLLRNSYPATPGDIPAVKAIMDAIPEYQPASIKALLPGAYWEMVKGLGKADVRGDPMQEGVKTAIRYLVFHAARHAGNVDDETATKLHDAEKAERVWLDCFSDLVRYGKEGKSKDAI